MSDQQSERAKFDAWLLRRAGPTGDEPGYPGPSAMFHDQELCAWEAWQARAALSAQAPSVPEDVPAGCAEVMRRMMAGIDHLSELARLWEPDHSSGADRRGWVLAKDARDDAARRT